MQARLQLSSCPSSTYPKSADSETQFISQNCRNSQTSQKEPNALTSRYFWSFLTIFSLLNEPLDTAPTTNDLRLLWAPGFQPLGENPCPLYNLRLTLQLRRILFFRPKFSISWILAGIPRLYSEQPGPSLKNLQPSRFKNTDWRKSSFFPEKIRILPQDPPAVFSLFQRNSPSLKTS